MKRPAKTASFVVSLTLTLVLSLLLAVSSYAWLTNYLAGGAFDFAAGELPPFALKVARITHSDELQADESARTYIDCLNYRIEAQEDGTHLSVDINNMSFGSIDNVAQLKPENILYLRLTIPQAAGNTVGLNFHYTDESFIVLYTNEYDADGNVTGVSQVTDETTLTDLRNVELAESAGDAFLLYTCAVSNVAYDATEIAANVPFEANEGNYSRFSTDAATELQLQNADYGDVAEGENWYVYVKVIPNLSVFAYSIEHIGSYMPCYMYFRIGASFEAKKST